jgi:hypothetical protein
MRSLNFVIKEGANYILLTFSFVFAGIFYLLSSISVIAKIELISIVYQCLGVLAVAWGIRSTRIEFKQSSWLKQFVDWLGNFRNALSGTHEPDGGLNRVYYGNAIGGNLGRQLYPPQYDGIFNHEWMQYIINSGNELHNKLDATSHALHETSERTSELLMNLEIKLDNLSDQFERVAARGLNIQVAGIIWLFLGTAGTALPVLCAAIQ